MPSTKEAMEKPVQKEEVTMEEPRYTPEPGP